MNRGGARLVTELVTKRKLSLETQTLLLLLLLDRSNKPCRHGSVLHDWAKIGGNAQTGHGNVSKAAHFRKLTRFLEDFHNSHTRLFLSMVLF